MRNGGFWHHRRHHVLEVDAHTKIHEPAFQRRPLVRCPPTAFAGSRQQQRIGVCLAHVREVLPVQVQLYRSEALGDQETDCGVRPTGCPIRVLFYRLSADIEGLFTFAYSRHVSQITTASRKVNMIRYHERVNVYRYTW